MPSYLVTGAEGQLGQCFRSVSEEFPNHQIFFANRKLVDINIPETIKKFYNTHPFNGIINCAAYTKVDQAEKEYSKVNQINSKGVENLKMFAEEKKFSLVHFSTDYVFDGTNSIPYQEDSKPKPINIYGESKYKGEQLLKHANCLNATFRISWLFSPFGNNFVKTILKLSQNNDTIKVVNNQWGRPTYGIDLARTILTHISEPYFFDYQCYHYASQGATTWFDFAIRIISLKNRVCEIKPCSIEKYHAVAKRPLYSVLDTERIEKHFSLDLSSWQIALENNLYRMQSL